MTDTNTTPDSVVMETTDTTQAIVERIEDGFVFIEFVENETVVERDMFSDTHLPDTVHEGEEITIHNTESGVDVSPLYRESAERQRSIRDKIRRMSTSMDDL